MKIRSQTIRSVVSIGVFMALAMSLQADYYVALTGSNTSPYDNWAKAATNIQTAVVAAPSGSTIWVADGTYSAPSGKTTIIDLSTGTLAAKSLTFYGNINDPTQVVLDGKGTQRGLFSKFSGLGQTLDVNGFTFLNCYETYYGGALEFVADSGKATVQNCRFVQNASGTRSGGAVAFESTLAGSDAEVLISNCVFLANSAVGGAALYASRHRSIKVVDCWAVGNTTTGASGGGAFSFDTSEVNLLGCTFVSNRCANAGTGGGGGLLTFSDSSSSSCALTGCHFEGNETSGTSLGGGAVYSRGSFFATNCVFRNNRSNGAGTAIYVFAKAPEAVLYNCLVVGNLRQTMDTHSQAIYGANTATGKYEIVNSTIVSNSGGIGVLGNSGANPQPTAEIRNSIIRYNQRANGTTDNYYFYGTGFSKIYNTATDPMPKTLWDGGGNTISDPKFVSLAGGDFHLQLGSPCIDTGLNQDWMIASKDLDGRPRLDPHSQKVDMGCYEFQKSGFVVIIR